MPNSIVKSFAEKTGLSIAEIEDKWESAKKYVKDELKISQDAGEKFWQAVTGTLKYWLRNKLKTEDFVVIDKMLKEATETGDVEKYEQPLGNQVLMRRPDGIAHDGNPFFNVDEEITTKLLDGKKKNEPWRNLIADKGIHGWANKNYLKSFHVKTKSGIMVKVR